MKIFVVKLIQTNSGLQSEILSSRRPLGKSHLLLPPKAAIRQLTQKLLYIWIQSSKNFLMRFP